MEGCRYPKKNWPRADNFKQHLKRIHNLQLGDNDLEQYTYKWAISLHKHSAFDVTDKLARSPEVSLASELVGLGTVIDDNLPAGDGNILGATWSDLEMQESCLVEDFPREDLGDQQPYHMLHSGDFSNAALEISPTETVSESDALQIPECRSEWPNSQGFAESANDDRSSEFVQYLDEDPMCQDDPSESDHCSVLYDGPEQTRRDEPLLELKHTDQQAMQISRDSSVDTEHGEVPNTNEISDNAPPLEGVNIPSTSNSPEMIASGGSPDSEPTDMMMKIQAGQTDILRPIADTLDIINDDNQALNFIKALKEKGTLTDLLEKLGYQIPQSTAPETIMTPPVHNNMNENSLVCHEEGCTKSFTRRCELKYVHQHWHTWQSTNPDTRKHEKRHVKPYACTFIFCDKKFGSKNDWKRHENSQHYQHELWKCNERVPTDPNDTCGKTCHRREQFRAHLAKDHSITTPADIELKLEQCLVGQNCDSNFWCGFCRMVIEVEDKGLKAWTSRFDHIDDHFSGRGCPKMDISQWKTHDAVHLETNPQANMSIIGSTDRHSTGSNSTSTSVSGARRAGTASKRAASDEVAHQPSRKKGRVLFYCVRIWSGMSFFSSFR